MIEYENQSEIQDTKFIDLKSRVKILLKGVERVLIADDTYFNLVALH